MKKENMFDKLRCQLKQFDVAWKSGLIVLAVVLVISILSRITTTLDIDQDPIVRKKLIEMLQHVKNCYHQAEQDGNPAVGLSNVSMARGYMNAALMLASADQIMKTASIDMNDVALRLNQLEEQLRAKLVR